MKLTLFAFIELISRFGGAGPILRKNGLMQRLLVFGGDYWYVYDQFYVIKSSYLTDAVCFCTI
jgi:hypothetical protein